VDATRGDGSTQPLCLQTSRLTITPFTAELIEALREDQSAGAVVGAQIPDGWPDNELADLLPNYRESLLRDPSALGFGPWIVVVRAERTVVGSAGFQGVSRKDGSVELGFGVHPQYRDLGYATEAGLALLAWAWEQPSVQRVVAHCEPTNRASIRVLEKLGMTPRGTDGRMLAWEADASSIPHGNAAN
jgi:ribosomal-protein-alanine N-acetyltransferase